MSDNATQIGTIRTDIPARLDRLPWSRFHWMIVAGLGTAWILDGLEVNVVGSISSRIAEHGAHVGLTPGDVSGWAASLYIAGACLGAIIFGQLTDRFGRKRLFMITLTIYLLGTLLTALSFSPGWFFAFRFLTGMGIGGEYSAINSAIDELIPSNHRGRVDISINGSYWLGGIGGALLAVLMLNTTIFPVDLGWRLSFVLGAIIGLAVLLVRRHVPESPRWLFIHGREQEAEKVVSGIEEEVERERGEPLPEPEGEPLTVHQRRAIPLSTIVRSVVTMYPRRTVLGLALFIGQAFLYNSILFGFGNLIGLYFHTPSGNTPYYIAVFAAGNFAGALLLSPLFRHRRAQADDRRHLHPLGSAADRNGALVQRTPARRHLLHGMLLRRVLLRVRRRERRLSDGVRDLPAGDARALHRGVLRGRDRNRRRDRPAGVQPHDQHQQLRAGVPRARVGRRDDDHWRHRRARLRDKG